MKPGIIWKDLRVVGSTVAIVWMLMDDSPRAPYSTFSDPGAAAMQSIILGEFVALAVQRRWDLVSWIGLLAAVVFKFGCQGVFYVTHAEIPDLATLLGAHLLAALLAGPDYGVAVVGLRCGAGLAGCLLAGGSCYAFGRFCEWRHYDATFWFLACARALFPYCFWSSLLLLPSNVFRKRGPETAASGRQSA